MTWFEQIARSRELGMSWLQIAGVVWLVAWPLLPMAVIVAGLAMAAFRRSKGPAGRAARR